MAAAHRSGCPINLTLEIVGDRWSLIVIRDIMFGNRRHFRELMAQSDEGIASNVLADRLKRLTEAGLLTRDSDSTHKQKAVYSLTEKSIQLVPLLAYMGAWGCRHAFPTDAYSVRARMLEEGGPALWQDLMEELRAVYLERRPSCASRSISESLRLAYEAARSGA